jgi:hypothetical protein
MKRHLITAVVAAMVGSLGCGIDVTAPEMVGEWGGEHILLAVSLTGGTVEYDCAHGTIGEAIAPDNDGNFTATGVHFREHGGPIREDEVPDEHPAVYSGWTNGRRMTLTVTLTDTGQVLGPYQLSLGDQAQLFKCL